MPHPQLPIFAVLFTSTGRLIFAGQSLSPKDRMCLLQKHRAQSSAVLCLLVLEAATWVS